MTETPGGTATASPPPPPPPPLPPPAAPLVRPRNGRVFRGVCAALGRATGTDPVLWRVLVVVLAVLGGTGIVLYLAGWLLVPDEGEPESLAQRLVRGGMSAPATVGVVVVAVLAVLLLLDDGSGIATLAVVGVLAWLVWRQRQQPAGATAGWSSPPSWTGPPAAPPGSGPAAWAGPPAPPPGWGPPPPAAWSAGPPPPPATRPPRPRSPLGLLTVSAVLLVVGGLNLADALGADGITGTRVLAAALLTTGAGLLVGAVWGRARWLSALAVGLALLLAASSAVDQDYDSSTGEPTWVVDGSAEHALGAGSAVLDLRPLGGTERRGLDVEARVGVGELVVLVPQDLRVDLHGEVGLGELSVVGTDGMRRTLDGRSRAVDEDLGPAGADNVRLEVRVGLGDLEVRRVASR